MFGLVCLSFHLLAEKKHTHKQVMSKFEQKKIKNDCQIFIRLQKTQIMVKYESCVRIEDFK